MSSTNPCAVQGNSDFYGFGIRLGTYFQFIATLLVTLFAPEEIPFYTALNNLWQTAMLAGLFQLTTSGSLLPVEPVICMLLMFGSLSSLTGDGVNPLGTLSGLYRLLIYTGVSGYGVWFWFRGLDITTTENALPCQAVVFFGDVSPYGKFRTFNKVMSCIGVGICVFCLVWSAKKFKKSTLAKIFGLEKKEDKEEEEETERKIDITLLLISVSIIILSIILCEYIVRANHMIVASTPQNPGIYNINAVGQVVPLLVGALGMIENLDDVWKGFMGAKKWEWYAFGKKFEDFTVENFVKAFKRDPEKNKGNGSVHSVPTPAGSGSTHELDEIKTANASAVVAGLDKNKSPATRTNTVT
jgi:hypothetical protein